MIMRCCRCVLLIPPHFDTSVLAFVQYLPSDNPKALQKAKINLAVAKYMFFYSEEETRKTNTKR